MLSRKETTTLVVPLPLHISKSHLLQTPSAVQFVMTAVCLLTKILHVHTEEEEEEEEEGERRKVQVERVKMVSVKRLTEVTFLLA